MWQLIERQECTAVSSLLAKEAESNLTSGSNGTSELGKMGRREREPPGPTPRQTGTDRQKSVTHRRGKS